jgi:hypothetical protein
MDLYNKLATVQLIFIVVSMLQKKVYALRAVLQTLVLVCPWSVKFNHTDTKQTYFTCYTSLGQSVVALPLSCSLKLMLVETLELGVFCTPAVENTLLAMTLCVIQGRRF